jgi:hypothetical protein
LVLQGIGRAAGKRKKKGCGDVKIKKQHFALAKLIKHLDESHFAIRYLHLKDGLAEITDGHMAVRMKTEEPGADLNVLLSPEDSVNIAQALSKDDHVSNVISNDDGKTVQVEFADGQIRILHAGTEKYPDLDAAIPKGKAPFSIGIDPDLMISALSAFVAGGCACVRLDIWSSERAVRLCESTLTREESAVSACFMPMRLGFEDKAVPSEETAA